MLWMDMMLYIYSSITYILYILHTMMVVHTMYNSLQLLNIIHMDIHIVHMCLSLLWLLYQLDTPSNNYHSRDSTTIDNFHINLDSNKSNMDWHTCYIHYFMHTYQMNSYLYSYNPTTGNYPNNWCIQSMIDTPYMGIDMIDIHVDVDRIEKDIHWYINLFHYEYHIFWGRIDHHYH